MPSGLKFLLKLSSLGKIPVYVEVESHNGHLPLGPNLSPISGATHPAADLAPEHIILLSFGPFVVEFCHDSHQGILFFLFPCTWVPMSRVAVSANPNCTHRGHGCSNPQYGSDNDPGNRGMSSLHGPKPLSIAARIRRPH